jgi:hypothetical protein
MRCWEGGLTLAGNQALTPSREANHDDAESSIIALDTSQIVTRR